MAVSVRVAMSVRMAVGVRVAMPVGVFAFGAVFVGLLGGVNVHGAPDGDGTKYDDGEEAEGPEGDPDVELRVQHPAEEVRLPQQQRDPGDTAAHHDREQLIEVEGSAALGGVRVSGGHVRRSPGSYRAGESVGAPRW